MFKFLKRLRDDVATRDFIFKLHNLGEAALKFRIFQHSGNVYTAGLVSALLLTDRVGGLSRLPDLELASVSEIAFFLVSSDGMFRKLLIQTLHMKYMVYSHDGEKERMQEIVQNPVFARYATVYPITDLEDYRLFALQAGQTWGLDDPSQSSPERQP